MNEWNQDLPAVAVPQNAKKRRPKRKAKKKGRRKIKRLFSETTMGHSLMLNAPLEYDLIVDAGGYEPSADLIETVSYASINPYFRSVVFRKLLIKYRINGCYQRIPEVPPDADTIKRYTTIRKNKIRHMCAH